MSTDTGKTHGPFAVGPVPASAGIGLRHPHVQHFLESAPATDWIEVHSENYLAAGGPKMRALEAIRANYPLSCHGVGLSLGSHNGLDADHLGRLKKMFARFEPDLVSEHVSWSVADGVYLKDLLPLPYTEEALAVVIRNVVHAQTALGRQILIENPSTYVTFAASTVPEWEFMAEIAARTGCAFLLDVNNVHVSAVNHGFDARRYIDAVPAAAVREIHVAGHSTRELDGDTILIDDHGAAVDDAVWRLLRRVVRRIGPRPTLVEWDSRIPLLPALLREAEKAEVILDEARAEMERHGAA